MTNADRIRMMTDEELADVIKCFCTFTMFASCKAENCRDCNLMWLKQKARVEDYDDIRQIRK